MDLARVRKRTGRIVPFNRNKVFNAINKAFLSVGKDEPEKVERVVEEVIVELKKRYNGHVMCVEEVQDVVEQMLIRNNFADVAKSYILYRQKHKEIREMKSLMSDMGDDLKLPVNSFKVLKARYLQRDEEGKVVETPKQLFTRVAKAIAEPDAKYGAGEEEVKATARKFFRMMASREFMPNSPTLFNAGTEKKLALSACFVLPVEDTIEGIFDAVKYMAIVQKAGGGTGFSFSRLRPKGYPVRSTRGVASGPLSFMRVFNTATDVIKQGGKRRGANMGVLRVDHPDIIDFISCKEKDTEMTNFNLSAGVTDLFMEAVEKGDSYILKNPATGGVVGQLNARKIFSLISTFAWKNGDPGIIFLDQINRKNPTPEVGEIEATNPCVTGDMLISTSKGLMRMEALAGEYSKGGLAIAADARAPINISCGGGASLLMQAGEKGVFMNNISRSFSTGIKEVYRLETESGYELEATPDHKILTSEGWVELKDSLGCTALIQSGEGKFSDDYRLPQKALEVFGKSRDKRRLNLPEYWSLELGQALGWLVGDGWLREGDKNCRVGFTFSKQDSIALSCLKPALNRWYGREIKEIWRENGVCHLSYHSKEFVRFFSSLGVKSAKAGDKEVPEAIFGAPKEAVIGFLQGLFSADGTIGAQETKQSYYIRLTSKSEKLLKGVQLLLLNLGVKSKIYNRSRGPRRGFQYRAVSGEERDYALDGTCFELNISRENIPKFLSQAGFLGPNCKDKMGALEGRRYYSERFEEKIVKIEPLGKKQVYDLTEPITHSMICNGIVAHNCGEQPLLPYESCNLGAINLARMIKETHSGYEMDWKKLKKTIEDSIHFLDNVIDANDYPIPQIEKASRDNRKIGLGVMGFSDALILLGIPYNSEKAEKFADEAIGFIQKTAREKSIELGRERGNFPNFERSVWKGKYPNMRNAAVTTIAPTGTTGIIADASSGIEPLFAISYLRKVGSTLGEDLVETNPLFEAVMRKKGLYSKELMAKVAGKASVQDIEDIPPEVRRVFVSAHDVSPEWHLRIQAAVQKHIDSAVSKTINLPNSATIQEIEDIYIRAWKLGCKGITVYRDNSRSEQVLNFYDNSKKAGENSVEGKLLTENSCLNENGGRSSENDCPNCGAEMVREEGCRNCKDCGYSVCG
jgi:ribonucleoside-diphosphate reductase alpha chain